MEPPPYEEAILHPPALRSEGPITSPPPTYYASLSSPSTPPPTYGEAVTLRSDPIPVPPPTAVTTSVTSRPQNTRNITHPLTQVGPTQAVNGGRTRPTVVVTQPSAVPVTVTYLRDLPGLVRCPHCHHTVTTKVTYLPGGAAWCMCVMLALMGLVCGFCLIPLIVRGLQDAHHSCPRCGKHLHVFTR
ncbi:lipopolysaccharide-induced tumor necrosis factor-alpha factor homolog isoform X1 [Scophthalmus maximus]|uniref:lipopolysaccharide-induced tumor necrosis factor-alpha factor homolog isoform X1 n=1 Tax=Scophthalmus maximus TaxID=52904 RepID=UPI0015E069A3|nr:lipopolysaccharide-induced tumor necrosis factor-alpha factor homolog isoform X1 [Scophthalmus maximus]XP_035494114.1 lipopolysaccharide-induced tumor necrosis factor-alpha factor homolog isoform X1 [Scophthalmus maximus]XP_035494115.1 lipopolysaccharide-induced tumor necrosis factor-alpha factor homolog isoform X1 [Scophthalmus maximus]